MDHFKTLDGVLHAEDVPLPAIAEAVGTPVYVYSQATLQRHARVFREGLSALEDPLILFAVKANPNLAVLRVLKQEGFGADVVSGGELRRALAAGMAPDKIVFSGVGKTRAELELGLDTGIAQPVARRDLRKPRAAHVSGGEGLGRDVRWADLGEHVTKRGARHPELGAGVRDVGRGEMLAGKTLFDLRERLCHRLVG